MSTPSNLLATQIIPYKHIIGFGPPAIGKGTAMRILAALRRNLGYIEMSSAIDWAVVHRNHLIAEQLERRHRGELMDDHPIMLCLDAYMNHHDLWGRTNVYDGIGRTVRQVIEFGSLIAPHESSGSDAQTTIVFDFHADADEIKRRAAQRVEEALAIGEKPRSDDAPGPLAKRLTEFNETHLEIIDAFGKFAKVVPIDASGAPQAKLKALVETLGWADFATKAGILFS